jgi:hypothetical protein
MENNKHESHAPTLTNLRMWCVFIEVLENLVSAASYVVRKPSHVFETFKLMDDLNLLSIYKECNVFKRLYPYWKKRLNPWPQVNFCDIFCDHVTYNIGVLRVKKLHLEESY